MTQQRMLEVVKTSKPPETAYYLAYRAALFETVRHVAADAELHTAEEDQ